MFGGRKRNSRDEPYDFSEYITNCYSLEENKRYKKRYKLTKRSLR